MDAQSEAVEKALRILGEHFDHVQLLASTDEDGVSSFFHSGRGNWYARQGMAHQFINIDMAQTTSHEMAKVMPRTDDDEDQEV